MMRIMDEMGEELREKRYTIVRWGALGFRDTNSKCIVSGQNNAPRGSMVECFSRQQGDNKGVHCCDDPQEKPHARATSE